MNILITGGAGYIGSHVIFELVTKGYQPISIDNLSRSNNTVYKRLERLTGKKIIHYRTDIRDTSEVTKILKKYKCQAVMHFASFKAVGESVQEPLAYYDNNVVGTISILRAMQEAGTPMIIFSSSTVAYGNITKLPMTEDMQIKPATNPYGTTKQMSERIIKDTCKASNIQALSLRYFNCVGAHPSGLIGEMPFGVPTFLVPFILETVSGLRDELTVFGNDYDTRDGSAVRDYIHVVDLAKAHVKAMEYLIKTTRGTYDVFNITSGQGSTVLEVIRTFEEANNVQVPHKIGPRRPGDIAASHASPKKAEELLKWKAELTLAQALEDAWRWQQHWEEIKND